MIAIPRKKIASPPILASVAMSRRSRAFLSSSIDMLPNEREDVARLIRHRDRAGFKQFLRLVIAPAGADAGSARRRGHRHVEARVAHDDRQLGRSARVGHRLADHRRVRLGWMTVRGLQRDEAGMDAVQVKAVLEAAGGFGPPDPGETTGP